VLEHERQREALRAALRLHLDEEPLTAQWFHRAGLSGDDGLRAFKAIRRWTARGEHPADRVAGWNVVALTPTQLVVFRGRPVRATPPVEIRDLVARWPLDRLALTWKRHKVESTFFSMGGSTYTSHVQRATLTWAGEARPLMLDLPNDKLSREFLQAARQAIAAAGAAAPAVP